MFEGKSLLEILRIGGFTMYVLLFCSFLSLAVSLERILYYRSQSKTDRSKFMATIADALKSGDVEAAIRICEKTPVPFSKVVYSGLILYGHKRKEISNAMDRQIRIETQKLERYTSVVGTIGNTAVYIGLLGTVFGIIRAFHDIAATGAGGMNVVIEGVAEALICTATGLLVAIPAVIIYNYFNKKVEHFIDDMELCASELMDLIGTE